MRAFESDKKGNISPYSKVFVPLLLLMYIARSIPVIAEESPLVMGVFPRKGFTRTLESFTSLAEHLSIKLGKRVIIKSGRTFADFWRGVEQRQYDFVHYNQYHYIRSKNEFGYEVIAKNEENHKSTMSGVLVVRKDSGIDRVADLRGKKILFGGGQSAMQSYIVASYLLQLAGLQQADYEFDFADSPPNAIYATFFRQAAAAGSADANLELSVVKKRIDISQLKVLAQGEQLAHLPWAVKMELATSVKKQLKEILKNLPESLSGQEALKRAGLTAIVIAEDKEYDAHRRITKLVLGEDYL